MMKKTFDSIYGKRHMLIAAVLSLAMILTGAMFSVQTEAYAADVTTVNIGEGTEATYWMPYVNGWDNARTQTIYRADEIGRDGAIESLAYNVASAAEGYKVSRLRIWMGYTDLDVYDGNQSGSIAGSQYTMHESDLTLVYEGRPQLGATTGWEKIELDTPFDYSREQGNLVIVTGVNASGRTYDITYFSTVEGKGDVDYSKIMTLIARDDKEPGISSPSYSGSGQWVIRSSRPNIQLGIDTSGGGTETTFDVTFDADGGSPEPQAQTVSKGGKVSEPEEPAKEGYKFTGWYRDDRRFDFESKVNASFTLKAGWVKIHRITFKGWDDEVLQTLDVEDGVKPEYTGETPARPAEGDTEYIFAGWDPAVKEADSDQTYTAVFVDKSELADKTELEAAVKKATDARTGVRTSEDGKDIGKNFKYVSAAQWQAYDDALKAAQAVVDDPYAKKAEVDQALTDLEAAKEEFLSARKDGTKNPPAITEIVISKSSGRQQPAVGGIYEWKVTFEKGVNLKTLTEGTITDDDFQIQRKPSGSDWKNSKCPYVGFKPSDAENEENVGYLTGYAIPDNTKEGDNTNLWRFIYSGDCAECPVITQDGYSKVDKTLLSKIIKDAEDAQTGVNVSADGWDVAPTDMFVTPDEKQAHDDAIAAAKAIEANDRVTQAQVDKAVEELAAATETFIKAKKGGNGEDEPGSLLPGDYHLIYETEKVTMADLPVREYIESEEGSDPSYEWFTEKPLQFEFYDSTAQQSGGVYTTKEGTYTDDKGAAHKTQMLSGIELIRGHNYIVSVREKDYMIPLYYRVTIADDGQGGSDSYTANMANYYIRLSDDNAQPTDIKNDEVLTSLAVRKRASELSDVEDGKRVNVRIPVYYTQDGTASTIITGVAGATIKLTSPGETLYATSDDNAQISVALIEDVNYMVQLIDESGALGVQTFPLVVKDHAENGWPKSIYNHYSCGSVQGIYLVDKAVEHAHDTKLVSISGKTAVTGQNFLTTSETNTDRYFIYDRQLDNSTVSVPGGRDYEVVRFEAVNMFRTEISRLAAGSFKITRQIPAGKTVENVCYVNKYGKLKTLRFTQKDGKVEFTMNTLSMYPNVIIYKAAAPKTSVSIKSGTVSAAVVKKAIRASGGNVTTLVLEKGVKKIGRNALKGTKIKTIIVKTKKLKKKSVKASLKGSKVRTIKVKVGSKKVNKKYVKKYKKIFTKKNAGKKVKVKR